MASTEPVARTAVTNVRVFDGRRLMDPGTVVIEGGRIGPAPSAPAGAETVDGEGGVLLPGLIDAHVHLHGRLTLEQLAGFGVTTALDMACAPELVNSLRGAAGLTDIRSAGTPAIAPGSPHSLMPVIGQRGLITGAGQARQFVAERVAEGSDYIKIVVGNPAPSHDQATLDALVAAAREYGQLTVAHASSYQAVQMAQRARVSVLTHVPLDQALDEAAAAAAVAADRILIPTLAMMEGIVAQSAPAGRDYAAARDSVTVMYRAGVPILAGGGAGVLARSGWSEGVWLARAGGLVGAHDDFSSAAGRSKSSAHGQSEKSSRAELRRWSQSGSLARVPRDCSIADGTLDQHFAYGVVHVVQRRHRLVARFQLGREFVAVVRLHLLVAHLRFRAKTVINEPRKI